MPAGACTCGSGGKRDPYTRSAQSRPRVGKAKANPGTLPRLVWPLMGALGVSGQRTSQCCTLHMPPRWHWFCTNSTVHLHMSFLSACSGHFPQALVKRISVKRRWILELMDGGSSDLPQLSTSKGCYSSATSGSHV